MPTFIWKSTKFFQKTLNLLLSISLLCLFLFSFFLLNLGQAWGSLSQLEQREVHSPSDSSVKFRLAAELWCQGEKALSWEKLDWLRQFATPGLEKSLATRFLALPEDEKSCEKLRFAQNID